MFEIINKKLSDKAVIEDISNFFRESEGPIDIDDEEIEIPPNVKLEVIAKSFHCYNYDIGFGNHYRSLVAVGGVKSFEHGIIKASLCFATLWYTEKIKLITVDFSLKIP